MSKVKSIFAYILAFLAVPLVMATLMGMNSFAEILVDVTGVTINPWYTGGEVAITVAHDEGYETRIHRPVFDALIGQRSQGFVQVEWWPRGLAPKVIDEDVDYDGDGTADFHLRWDTATQEAELTPLDGRVLGLEGAYFFEKSYAIRVSLENK